jgi:hypothetical protein
VAALMLVALAWMYVVVLMAVSEALGPSGSVLGAIFTLLGYGVLPLGVVLYIGSARLRRRARARAEAAALAASTPDASTSPPDVGAVAASASGEGGTGNGEAAA